MIFNIPWLTDVRAARGIGYGCVWTQLQHGAHQMLWYRYVQPRWVIAYWIHSIVCLGIVLSYNTHMCVCIKLMKGKALMKHSLHEKTAASVLLKPFICSNEWCHTTDAPWRMSGTRFSNVNNIHVHSMIPEDQKNMTTQWCSSYGPAWRTLDVVMWWSICTTMARSCGFNRSSLRSIICQNIYSCISLPMQ